MVRNRRNKMKREIETVERKQYVKATQPSSKYTFSQPIKPKLNREHWRKVGILFIIIVVLIQLSRFFG